MLIINTLWIFFGKFYTHFVEKDFFRGNTFYLPLQKIKCHMDKRIKDGTIIFRIAFNDKKAIEEAAKTRGVSVSKYLRLMIGDLKKLPVLIA